MGTKIFVHSKHLYMKSNGIQLNSLQVNSLHLHLVDMKAIGPTFKQLDYKNCPLNAVLKARMLGLNRAERPIGIGILSSIVLYMFVYNITIYVF